MWNESEGREERSEGDQGIVAEEFSFMGYFISFSTL
jgi:hypothetical protein